ncbi:MAG: hypothetical protein Q4A79_00155 [Candidatus Saccharibacteria bacterium]|nr:hypothetical protein [Candidatus Saccharibacteria bacterium]
MEKNVASTMPATDSSKQNDKKGWRIATAIASVVAVCGISFGAYGMMRGPQEDNQTTVTIADSLITPENYGFMADNFVTHSEDATISWRTEAFGAIFSLVSDGSVFITIQGDDCHYFGDVCSDGFYRSEITPLIPGRVVDFSVNTYGNESDGFAFFVLDDGTVASLSEFSAAKNEQATIVEGSKNIFRLFGGSAQDTSGKIYRISPTGNGLKQFKISQ